MFQHTLPMTPPDYLYKYQELSAYSLAALINSSIWLAKPETFNDPFDCPLTLNRNMHEEIINYAVANMEHANLEGQQPEFFQAVKERALGETKELFDNFRENIFKITQNLGICSLSAIPDHLLMWSHYANYHRGFCVKYDCREGTILRKHALKVQYEDSFPSISLADMVPPNYFEKFGPWWLTKATCWSYEKEWRIILSEKGNMSYIVPSAIVSVIFGVRMPESDQAMINHALRNEKNIQFKKAVLKEDQFLIEIVDV